MQSKLFSSLLLIIFCSLSHRLVAQLPKLMLPIGHVKKVNAVSFSPDGKRVLTASDDETAKLWDLTTGKLLANISSNSGTVDNAVFSPDNRKFLTHERKKVRVWDITGKLLFTINKDSASSTYRYDKVFFNHDGTRIITAGVFLAKLWDANTGKMIADWSEGETESEHEGSLSKDGKMYANTGVGSFKIWDVKTGELISKNEDADITSTVRFSEDGKYLISDEAVVYEVSSGDEHLVFPTDEADDYGNVSYQFANLSASGKYFSATRNLFDSLIRIWDYKSQEIIFEKKGMNADSVVFSPDESSFYVFSNDAITAWSIDRGKLLFTIPQFGIYPTSVFSPDKKRLVSTMLLVDSARLYDLENGNLISVISGHNGKISTASFHEDGKYLATAGDEGPVKIWDGKTGKLLMMLRQTSGGIYTYAFSPDHRQFIPVTGANYVKVLDIYSGKTLFTLPHADAVFSASYSKDGKKILTASLDKNLIVWDGVTGAWKFGLIASTDIKWVKFCDDNKTIIVSQSSGITLVNADDGKRIRSYDVTPSVMNQASYASDHNHLINLTMIRIPGPQVQKPVVNLIDAKTGKLKLTRTGHKELGVTAAEFSPNGKYMVVAGTSSIELIDVTTAKTVFLKNSKVYFRDVKFSPDGNRLLVLKRNENIPEIWDAKTGNLILQLKGHTDEVFSGAFSADGSEIVTASKDNTIKTWNATNGLMTCNKIWSGEEVARVEFSTDKEKLITQSESYTMAFWDKVKCNNTFELYAFDAENLFYKTPLGYYMCSPDASRLIHYVTKDLSVITFDQLDVKYNRPDKVLESIGSRDTSLIRSYRKAWEKRIQKLRIDTTSFREDYNVPVADFTNRDKVQIDVNGKLKLNIKASDNNYKLDRFNIWVNEVPVFGQRGINIRDRNSNSFDTSITINLSQGINFIETSVSNINGIESYRIPFSQNYSSDLSAQEKIHFIGIGLDQFADSTYNLQYSVKDIRDLAAKLKSKFGSDVVIDTLFNQQVSISSVKALKTKLLSTNPNDKVIIAYSGHGLLSKDYDYFLSTWSVNFERPQEKGLAYADLEDLLDSIPARKKLMLIDACHSGEVDKEDLVSLNASSDSLVKGLKPVAYKKEGQLGLKNSFELMQSLFVNVGKSTGATVISAAAGTQFALERNDLKNGVFTYCILEAMNKYPTLTVSDLRMIVGERVVELTNGLQRPTSRNENKIVDWIVW